MTAIAAFLRKRAKHRDVLKLVAGTAVAQLILILVAPILTRLYDPDEFGLFALYYALVSYGNSIASLRYEFAIPLPQDDEDGRRLLYLTIVLTGLFSTTLMCLLVLGHDAFVGWLGEPKFIGLLWVVPVGVFFESMRVACRQGAIRFKNYQSLAQNDAGQAMLRAASQIGLGAARLNGGLIFGDILGRIGGASALLLRAVPGFGHTILSTSLADLRRLAARYRRFAILSTPATFLNSATLYLPMVVITRVYGLTAAGFYALTQRLIGIPLLLLGKSILQVYFGRAAELRRTGTRSIERLFLRTFRGTFFVGFVVIAPIGLVGSWATPLVFGEAWTEAGVYLRILLPMYIVRFAANGVGPTLEVLERQDLALGREAFRFGTTLGALGVVIAAGGSSRHAMWSLSVAGTLGYGVYLWTSWRAIRASSSDSRNKVVVGDANVHEDSLKK